MYFFGSVACGIEGCGHILVLMAMAGRNKVIKNALAVWFLTVFLIFVC
jgi:hypothetical protein